MAFALCAAGQSQSGAEQEFAAAMRLIGQGDFSQAEQKLRALEKAHPGLFEIHYRLGLVLMRQGKDQEAAPRIEAAVRQSPASAPAWLAAAQVRSKLGNRDGAIAAAGRAANLAPREPGFHYLLGQVYRTSRRPAEAAAEFQQAIRLAPNDWQPYAALAGMFLDHRTPEPAIALLQAAPKEFHRIAEYHRMLGLACYQTGKREQAIDEFLAIADLEPDSDIGYTSLETLLPEAGARRAELARRFDVFRSRQPRNPVGHFLLARAQALDGAPPAVVEPLLRQAITVEHSFWPAYYELGLLLETQGNNAEAVRLLTQVVEINPDYAAAHFALSRLYAKQGDRPQAVAHRKKHAELLESERQKAARAREESPALNYRLDSGGNSTPAKER